MALDFIGSMAFLSTVSQVTEDVPPKSRANHWVHCTQSRKAFFFGGVTFENVLMAAGHAEKTINKPKGKVLSLDGDGTTLQNLEPESVAVCMVEMAGWEDKGYGDVRDCRCA